MKITLEDLQREFRTTRRETLKTILAATNRGVALLDRKIPTWRTAFRGVPISVFNFSLPDHCVLGTLGKQIKTGNFKLRVELPPSKQDRWDIACYVLDLEGVPKGQYGFDHVPGVDWQFDSDYAILQFIWEKEIWG